jgi:SP family arabinose:H+ symporter-like MFS transporter
MIAEGTFDQIFDFRSDEHLKMRSYRPKIVGNLRHRRITIALLFTTGVAASGGFLFGFDTAVIAGTTHALTSHFYLTPVTLGVTVSCALWGTVAGGLLAFLPAERWGGRDSLRLAALLYLVSALGCASAWSWYGFLAFRFIGGLAIGGCSVFAPMYIAETSPPLIRGKLVGCFQLSIVTGILVAYASNSVIGSLHLHGAAWRIELGVAAIPSLFFWIGLFFIPRSPYWLVKHDRLPEARRSLGILGFLQSDVEVERIQHSLQKSPGHAKQSVFRLAYRRPLLIALALGLFNQLSGINAVLYYANDIFARAGFGSASAGKQAVAVGVTNLLFTILGMALIDRLGRKPLLLAGSVVMALALAGISAIFLAGRHQLYLLPLLLLFIASFAASQGAVVWVYLSEIFPNAVRESGQSLASFWLWLLTAVVAGVFPVVAARSPTAPFLIFCFVCVLQFIVVLLLFPETRGRSLEA